MTSSDGSGKRRWVTRSSDRYGTGKSMLKIPALPEVYQSEDLPQVRTPDAVSPAEHRHLRSTRTLGFAQKIQKSQQKPRSIKPKTPEAGWDARKWPDCHT